MKKNGSMFSKEKMEIVAYKQANFSGKEKLLIPHTLANHTDFKAYNIELGRRYQGL